MHSSFEDGASGLGFERERERDLMFFFEVCEATFFVVMASLKKMVFQLESLHFEERDKR